MLSADLLRPVSAHPDDGMAPGMALAAGLRSGLGDEWLRIGPLKIFADGSLIGRTCWMERGFEDDRSNTGYPQAEPDRLRSIIMGAHLGGWQVATHAIGDAAVAFVLDCYEAALGARQRPDHRHRIEHCGIAPDHLVARIAELGVVPVPQGRFIGEIGDGMLAAVGPEWAFDTYRLRTFVDAGISIPGSSDRPVVDGRPLLGMEDMVQRLTETGQALSLGEALTAEQALRAYTAGSAYAEHVEQDRGSLVMGQLADFVVLGDDPRRVPPREISAVPFLATVVGGELVHDARARQPFAQTGNK